MRYGLAVSAGMSAALMLSALMLSAPGAGAQNGAQNGARMDIELGPPLLLEDISPAAEIRIAIPRAAEMVPPLFRLVLDGAKSGMAEFKREAQTEYKAAKGEKDFHWFTWSYDLSYLETYARAPLYSLLESQDSFTGGAHGNTTLYAINFDTRTAAPFGLYELFDDISDNSPVLKAIQAYVKTDLGRQKKARMGAEYYDPASLDDVKATADMFRVFTLLPAADQPRASGIVIHFAPYEVGAYAEGMYSVLVPVSVFQTHLKEDFAGFFGGKPVKLEPVMSWESPRAVVYTAKPKPDAKVSSPVAVSGEAPAYWFFEGGAPVEVRDDTGKVLGKGIVRWKPAAATSGIAVGMVPYSGKVKFKKPKTEAGSVVIGMERETTGARKSAEEVGIYVTFKGSGKGSRK